MASTASAMNDSGEKRGNCAQEPTEGGLLPALVIDPGNIGTNPTSTAPGVRQVFDLDSFRHFVHLMAIRCQDGFMSREDALSMIADVAKWRKLNETFGIDEVCSIIKDEFLCVVDAVTDGPPAGEEPEPFRGVITADRLQVKRFKPVMFLLPPLIAEGVTLLAGKPKLGKSWLTLDIAQSVARGTSVLGTTPAAGEVLGLFLEDSERRLQVRLTKLQVNSGEAWPKNLSLATRWQRIDEGGLADLEIWCQSAQNPRAIIIDTLAKLRPSMASRKTQYELDYDALSGLHQIAHKYQVAIIVVTHTRKADAEDVFDTVSGTLGLTGAADSILILSKQSGKAILHARGRDIEDSETVLKFEPACCRWMVLGDAADVLVSDERDRIRTALESTAEPMSPKEVMLATGIKNRNSIDLLLLRMVRDGQIARVGRGKYVNAGKIGKKEPVAAQRSDAAKDSSAPVDLSDLSAKEEPGGTANETTTP
jgi:AAA domain